MIDFTDRTYWHDIFGNQVPDEENMLCKLLDDGLLFCNSRKFLDLDGKISGTTIVVFFICNDLFAPAADCENITLSELVELFKLYETNGTGGSVQWICVKRNEQPRKRVIENMKKKGEWNDILENLPKNYCDSILTSSKSEL